MDLGNDELGANEDGCALSDLGPRRRLLAGEPSHAGNRGTPTDPTPAHGQLTLSDDGGFTYEPEEGYAGEDGFRYRATDGEAEGEAQVSLAVGAVAGKGCGCASGVGGGWWLALGVVGLFVRRR